MLASDEEALAETRATIGSLALLSSFWSMPNLSYCQQGDPDVLISQWGHEGQRAVVA